MKFHKMHFETTVLLVIACGFLMLSLPAIHLSTLDPIDNAYLWNRSSVITSLLITYGMVLLVLAMLSYLFSSRDSSLVWEVSRHCREASAILRKAIFPSMWQLLVSRQNVIWLGVVLCIGIGIRGYFLSQPMRYDEAYTFLNFVNANITSIFYYPLPNNHVLHTILVKFSSVVWGPHPESIRFPAFLAGTASIPLMFCVCRKLLHGPSGIFGTVAISVFPYLVLYSTMARGYSIVVFLTLALLFVGAHVSKKPSIASSAILSSIAALGLLTMPSMVFPIAGIYLWLVCLLFLNGNKLNRILRQFIIPCAVMTLSFTAVLYSPVIFVSKGLETLLENEFVQSRSSAMFFDQTYPHFAHTLAHYSRDIPNLILISCLILLGLGVYGAGARRNWPVLLILPSVLIGSGVIFFLKHAIPFPRTWIYLIPIVLVVGDAGFTYCIEKLATRLQFLVRQGMIVAGGLSVMFLISTNAIVKYPDTGTFPEAPLVASYLKSVMNDGDRVYAMVPADYPIYFYLWYQRLGDFRDRRSAEEEGAKTRAFFVVKKSEYSVEDALEKHEDTNGEVVVKLIEVADAAIYRNHVQDDAGTSYPIHSGDQNISLNARRSNERLLRRTHTALAATSFVLPTPVGSAKHFYFLQRPIRPWRSWK